MSNIEEAYSLEYKEIMDSEKAYELFWDGSISDKRAFQCTDPSCEAQITCCNIDKKRAEMKQKIHFKCYGEHSEYCDVIKDFNEKNEMKSKNDSKSTIRYINNEIDIFELNRPPKHKENVNTKNIINNCYNHREQKEKLKDECIYNGSRNATYHSLKPFISKFEKYSLDNSLCQHSLKIKGFNITYDKMFLEIVNTDIEMISSYNRIYYGIGKIQKVKNNKNDFMIFFQECFHDTKIKTSIYLSSDVINQHYRKIKWRNELENLVQMNEATMFYIYSKPQLKEKIVYLPMKNMDFIDYRVLTD